MKRLKLNDVDCKYGAPMGRTNWLPNDLNSPLKLQLQQVRMIDHGAYDHGGAYWGISNPLYCAWGYENEGEENEENVRVFTRGKTREEAKQKIRELLPNVRFYR
jgi:hypothetical protein